MQRAEAAVPAAAVWEDSGGWRCWRIQCPTVTAADGAGSVAVRAALVADLADSAAATAAAAVLPEAGKEWCVYDKRRVTATIRDTGQKFGGRQPRVRGALRLHRPWRCAASVFGSEPAVHRAFGGPRGTGKHGKPGELVVAWPGATFAPHFYRRRIAPLRRCLRHRTSGYAAGAPRALWRGNYRQHSGADEPPSRTGRA